MHKSTAHGIRKVPDMSLCRGLKRTLFPGSYNGMNIGNKKGVRNIKTFTFYTDFVGTATCNWAVSSGNPLRWDFGDGQSIVQSNPTVTITQVGTKKVTVYADDLNLVTSCGFQQINGYARVYDFSSCVNSSVFNIGSSTVLVPIRKIIFPKSKVVCTSVSIALTEIGPSLDLSNLRSLSGSVSIASSPFIETVTFPTISGAHTTFNVTTCTNLKYLDLTPFGNFLAPDIRINTCNLLKYILFPSSNTVITFLRLQGNPSIESYDLSGLSGLGGDVQLFGCTICTSITFPTSSQVFSILYFFSNNITGTVNMSGLTGFGGDFRCQLNPLLTGITLPTSSQLFTFFFAYQCNITGTLDFSPLSKLGGNVEINNNPLMTAVILPSSTQTFVAFYVNNCAVTSINFTACPNMTSVNLCTIQLQTNGLKAAQVNTMLIDLDTISSSGFTGRLINIAGTNAAPTGAGLTAKTSLQGKGFTVTTN